MNKKNEKIKNPIYINELYINTQPHKSKLGKLVTTFLLIKSFSNTSILALIMAVKDTQKRAKIKELEIWMMSLNVLRNL